MYTCSHPKELDEYNSFFVKDNINFDYINENPEVMNTSYGYYENKPYINVLLDDKAGFSAETDWGLIRRFLKIKGLWANYQ